MSKQIGFGILGVLGVICIIGASVFLGLFRGIIDKKIKEELPLNEGSDTFKRWQKVDVPVSMKFHLFELTNNQTFNDLTQIKLVEKGPYIFEETRAKERISYFGGENNKTFVKYEERKYYKYNQKLSNLSLDEEISIINIPFLGMLLNTDPIVKIFIAPHFGSWVPSLSDPNEKSLFTKRRVGSILFDGFPVQIFSKIAQELNETSHIDIKTIVPGFAEKFAIFDKGTNYTEEPWAIYSGIDNMDKYGDIYEFDNHRTLVNDKTKTGKDTQIWPLRDPNATSCNALKGTDGTMFTPSLSKSDTLYAFEPQLCRTVFFTYVKETSVQDIDTYRYRVPPEYFQSPIHNVENACYCIQKDVTECDVTGVLDISNCLRLTQAAPVVMSAPYFNNGDDKLRNEIHLEHKHDLNDDNYGTYLDVEPMTGTVLRAVRRLQINIKLSQTPHVPELANLTKEYVIPLAWIEETGEADEKQADDFKSMVTNKLKLGIGIAIAVIVIGALMTITAIVLFVRHKRNYNNSQSKR